MASPWLKSLIAFTALFTAASAILDTDSNVRYAAVNSAATAHPNYRSNTPGDGLQPSPSSQVNKTRAIVGLPSDGVRVPVAVDKAPVPNKKKKLDLSPKKTQSPKKPAEKMSPQPLAQAGIAPPSNNSRPVIAKKPSQVSPNQEEITALATAKLANTGKPLNANASAGPLSAPRKAVPTGILPGHLKKSMSAKPKINLAKATPTADTHTWPRGLKQTLFSGAKSAAPSPTDATLAAAQITPAVIPVESPEADPTMVNESVKLLQNGKSKLVLGFSTMQTVVRADRQTAAASAAAALTADATSSSDEAEDEDESGEEEEEEEEE